MPGYFWVIKMNEMFKKNVGITDRLIRFVAVDLLLGISYLGTEQDPILLSSIAFITSIIIMFPLITGYSILYRLFNISTRGNRKSKGGALTHLT